MSTLWLVRHAQASFLETDYDRLSPLGHTQARLLGQHWSALGVKLDRVVSGPRRRQIHTAELALEALAAGGAAAPAIEVIEELDEYRADEILERHLPELGRAHPEIGAHFSELSNASDRRQRARAFDRLLQRVLGLWAEDAFACEVESFAAFRERVARALGELTRGGSGTRVAAFSSGGAIGALVAELLGAGAEAALELGWNVNNAGVTEILWSEGRRSLRRFNAIAHLPDPATWTFR